MYVCMLSGTEWLYVFMYVCCLVLNGCMYVRILGLVAIGFS